MTRLELDSAKLPNRASRRFATGLLVVALALMAGCATQSSTQQSTTSPPAKAALNVSAASSLKSVLASIAPTFEKTNNVKLLFNYGASGLLIKQIEGGSPTDVFLSADASRVDTLTAEGLISVEGTVTFAGNDLAILVAAGNPTGIHGPNDLLKAAKLTTGDPAVVPQGAKAQEWLTNIGLWGALKPKFVFAGNAAQTDDYVARGEVDAGIGFASDARGRTDIEVAYRVPAAEITPIKYVGGLIKESKQAELGSQFVTYLLSPDAQKAFADAGFKPVPTQ
ncbi:MAG: molybdate ABC transporter substrate-binding protein [Coriobacteriia bacterium]